MGRTTQHFSDNHSLEATWEAADREDLLSFQADLGQQFARLDRIQVEFQIPLQPAMGNVHLGPLLLGGSKVMSPPYT